MDFPAKMLHIVVIVSNRSRDSELNKCNIMYIKIVTYSLTSCTITSGSGTGEENVEIGSNMRNNSWILMLVSFISTMKVRRKRAL